MPDKSEEAESKPTFEVAELQQMTDPIAFIEKTLDQYPGLDLDDLRSAFEEVRQETQRVCEEKENKDTKK
jgi:exonuclease SbcD